MELVLTLIVAAGLGLIPAYIAKEKGHSFALWWFYGWMLFIVAIVHVQFIEDYGTHHQPEACVNTKDTTIIGSADEIKKYKELLDQEIITQQEFERKKRELLNI